MNAYQELQGSGIRWLEPPHVSLYQPAQSATIWPEPSRRDPILEGFEEQMADFALEHAAALNELRRYFVLPGDSSVSAFLTGHRALLQILFEAADHLKLCFGSDAVLNLRTRIDDSGAQTLYVVAMWRGSVLDVRQALSRFDDTWWLAHLPRASGRLVFTYELV